MKFKLDDSFLYEDLSSLPPFFFLVVLGRDLDEREVREQGSDEKLSNMI